MNASTETAAPPLMSITVLIATSPALMVASSVASETLRERSWTLSASCRLMSSIGVSSQSKCSSPRCRDPHAADLDQLAPGDHTLGRRRPQPDARGGGRPRAFRAHGAGRVGGDGGPLAPQNHARRFVKAD